MNQDRFGDYDDLRSMAAAGGDSGSQLPPSEPGQPSAPAEAAPGRRGFTVQPGGRNAITGTAERIGSAVGTAQRQVRRGLELVRPARRAEGNAGQPTSEQEGESDFASRMIQAIEQEVAETRRQASQFSQLAEDQLHQLRDGLRDAFSRSWQRTRDLVADYPVQTLAAIAGVCLLLAVALRSRSQHPR